MLRGDSRVWKGSEDLDWNRADWERREAIAGKVKEKSELSGTFESENKDALSDHVQHIWIPNGAGKFD